MTSLRIWHGCKVVATFSVDDHGYTATGAVGGAQNSSRADIELDPWANLVVDHRAEYPTPVSIRYEEVEPPEIERDEPWDADDIPQSIVDHLAGWPPEVSGPEMLAQLFHMYDKARGRA